MNTNVSSTHSSHWQIDSHESFFVPLELIKQWVNTGSATKESKELAVMQMERRIAQLEEQIRVQELEAKARQAQLQLRLSKSLSLRLFHYLGLVFLGVGAFLIILIATSGTIYFLNTILDDAGFFGKKLIRFLEVVQTTIVAVDAMLLAIYLYRATLNVIVEGKILS